MDINDQISNSELSPLPMNALQEVPAPNDDARQIIGLVKRDGRISGYQLSDGRILDKQDAVQLARQGGIAGVGISSRKGNEYLKSLPDNSENNNLGNLPTITQ